MKRILSYLLPSLGGMLFILVMIGALGLGPRMMNVDGDLGRHLTIGAYILETGKIPLQDLFSHTMPGMELTPHEWLSQVLFALSYRWLGLNGPVFLAALVIALAIYLSFRQALRRSQSVLAALTLGVLAMAASSLHWLTRPHIFTFLCLVLWGIGLERLRRGKLKGWFWMPVLMLVWANLHGAFISGFMLWVLYGLGYLWETRVEASQEHGFGPGFGRYFLLTGALSGLVTLINPAGWKLWSTSLGFLGSSYLVGHTAEYMSPDFHSPSTWPFLLLIVAGLALFGLSGRRRNAIDAIVFTALAAMGLFSTRNIPLFALLAAPLLAETGRQVLDDLSVRLGILKALVGLDQRLTVIEQSLRGFFWPTAAVILSAALLWMGIALDIRQSGNRFDPSVFPAAAVDWLEKNPQPGEMYNYFPWGGYLLYREWPKMRVFIDGQTDFYGEPLTREYEQVLTLQTGWESVLAKYQVGWVLIPPGGELSKELGRTPGWTLVYQDATAVLYAKR